MRTTLKSALAALIYLSVSLPVCAQVTETKRLTLDGARQVAAAAVAEARRNQAGGAIAVVDDGGNLMYLERIDNTFPAGANISIGKARTAALFKRPTSVFEKIIREGRTPMVALSDFTPLQGGVPIVIDGEVVGAVGVSGAASAQQDENIAVVAANALQTHVGTNGGTNGTHTESASIKYFDRDKVKAAFAKGAPLIEVEHYKVHASHREAPGMAEVHTRDTDIIYVLEGSATFITGGSVVDGKTTAPDEIRGASITNGEVFHLKPGDIIIVPSGIPHWFKEVSNPFNYYVVKTN